jgi:hypothetical protein
MSTVDLSRVFAIIGFNFRSRERPSMIDDKYQRNKDYRRFSCNPGEFNIDAKINGAYIAMGLLYGEGNIEKTTVISMRCGQPRCRRSV